MPEKLEGIDKVAVLLILLGPAASAQIFQSLNQDEIAAVSAAMARMREIPREMKEEVLSDFYGIFQDMKDATYAGPEYVEQLLRSAIGTERASDIFNAVFRSASFEFLKTAPMKSLAAILAKEHPQTVAVVMAQLGADQAAQVLGLLPEGLRIEAVRRSANLEHISTEVMEQIGKVLEAALGNAKPGERTTAARLADIISLTSRQAGDGIMAGLKATEPVLAEDILKHMFVFEDVAQLPDAAMQKIMRAVDQRTLAVCLKGAAQKVSERFYRNMTEDASKALGEDVDSLGALPPKSIEEAQQKVVRTVRLLVETGDIPELVKAS